MPGEGIIDGDAVIGFSNHRPETVPFAAGFMECFDTICLEDPPSKAFVPMLDQEMAVEDYLLTLDLEYPEFSRRMCNLLREMHRKGKRIVQVEPYLEHLLSIHERFAAGAAPADLPEDTPVSVVYRAEHEATAALLAFYKAVACAGFDEVVRAVKRFARVDARRFVIRDRMRAEALAPVIARDRSVYVEAGQMHFALPGFLRTLLSGAPRILPRFLTAPTARALGGPAHLYGPGDVLTLLYIFHPHGRDAREDLLAARALVYNKLIEKEETQEEDDALFHTRDEIRVLRTVQRLEVQDCRRLYPILRRVDSGEARRVVKDYLR